MRLETIQVNARLGSIATCKKSHEREGSVVRCCVPTILHLKYEMTGQQYVFRLEADIM